MLDMCPYCNKTAILVDGVNKAGKISYVCRNPDCRMYKQAFYATGEEAPTTITEEDPVREESPIEEPTE